MHAPGILVEVRGQLWVFDLSFQSTLRYEPVK